MADVKIQIYGIRTVEDARMVIDMGAHHIGVSYGRIKRTPGQLTLEKAKEADLKFAESRGGKTQKAAPKKDKFNYEQRNWDFDELERLKREELRRNLEE